MLLKVVKSDISFPDLQYATDGSAGFDLYYPYEDVSIPPNQRVLVASGVSLEIPNGYEGQIRSRSGFSANHGIIVLNAPATIDSDYRGEVKILLFNTTGQEFILKRNMRIAQMVISKVQRCNIEYVESLSNTARGEGGFGSSGYTI